MANPSVVSLVANTWTKVAENVTAGNVHVMKSIADSGGRLAYYQTYRLTGEAAPTTTAEAVPLLAVVTPITASAAIDVYIRVSGGAGKIRVDV